MAADSVTFAETPEVTDVHNHDMASLSTLKDKLCQVVTRDIDSMASSRQKLHLVQCSVELA